MIKENSAFHLREVLHDLRHYLPAQSPLKDFIHHNTLHAFQNMHFFDALRKSSVVFGFKTTLSLNDYRKLYKEGKIYDDVINRIITENKPNQLLEHWRYKMLDQEFGYELESRIGKLRQNWKSIYKIDMDAMVQPMLFRLISSYLDQGISIWNFPVIKGSFLESIRELNRNSLIPLFQSDRVKRIINDKSVKLEDLLEMLVGDESLYSEYLFDQQYSHQGWSGMVSVLEENPSTLLDPKPVSLHDFIYLELLLELNTLDTQVKGLWKPLASVLRERPVPLFAPIPESLLHETIVLWQKAYEWSYYDQVLNGVLESSDHISKKESPSFQAMFCMDDRECSIRRHIEHMDPSCMTYGTPGFFGVAFYYQPKNGKFLSKLCPAPVTPTHLVREINTKGNKGKDAHFTKHSHGIIQGWVISQTLGFWSALRLAFNIFKPSMGPATTSSFKHMDALSNLTFENKDPNQKSFGLQVGFTIPEMTDRVEALLRSIGLTDHFAPLVYAVAHGASSINNTHYAGYDCGACSGRPGSVNARVLALMANHKEVRKQLSERGINIPESTIFMGALHDTTRDEILFYDEKLLPETHKAQHQTNVLKFNTALDYNAKERSRRFILTNTHGKPEKVHERVKLRSVSLFEPRPELNHATNALCVIGRRGITDKLFLDRRSFMNSYDCDSDPDGKYLAQIIKPIGPVAGGINLEYYFSQVDNQKLGAGTKLPHNVVGLIGVANGIEGDLRPGLPSQMIEVHDPIRLLVIVEQKPEIVLKAIRQDDATYEWYANEWVHLCAYDPYNHSVFRFENGEFKPYQPLPIKPGKVKNLEALVESTEENLPVLIMED